MDIRGCRLGARGVQRRIPQTGIYRWRNSGSVLRISPDDRSALMGIFGTVVLFGMCYVVAEAHIEVRDAHRRARAEKHEDDMREKRRWERLSKQEQRAEELRSYMATGNLKRARHGVVRHI